MATYGYAGDFSSDDDEKLEQVQAPAKYDNALRPSKTQIEEAINDIKQLPYDQEISLSDDVLAGLLDYYQTQRGPIVDSTRKLYNKIALRLVRDDQDKGSDGLPKDTNGNNNNNNNNNNLPGNTQAGVAEAFSSDDEDIEVTTKLINNNNPKKFDSSVVYGNNNVVGVDQDGEDEDKMEVDSEPPSGTAVRDNKPIELATTDDDESSDDGDKNASGDDSESDDSSKSGDSDESDGDVLEVTPIRAPNTVNREKEAVEVLMGMRPSTPKQTDSSTKRQPLAHSTPKDSFIGTAKKHYTRSQRVTTRSATRMSRSNLTSSAVISEPLSDPDPFIKTRARRKPANPYVVAATVLAVFLAFLVYQFRSSIYNTAEPLLRKKISF